MAGRETEESLAQKKQVFYDSERAGGDKVREISDLGRTLIG